MTKIPRLTGKEIVSALRKAEFEVIRIKGSHHFMRHQDGRTTVIPVHKGETIGPGLIGKVLHDCEMTIEEFRSFL